VEGERVIVALCVGGCFAFLYLVGRYNESATAREWEMALGPEGQKIYDTVEETIHAQGSMIESSYATAEMRRSEGSMEEAVRLLRVGSRAVEACAPSFLHLLKSIGQLSRHAAALAPIAPLRVAGFRTAQLKTLAGLHQICHHLLVTARERLQLRLAVIACGLRAVMGRLLRTSHRTAVHPEREADWARVQALRADLVTLTAASLVTLQSVLASLSAVPAAARPSPARPAA
jgi:hypothetical protein